MYFGKKSKSELEAYQLDNDAAESKLYATHLNVCVGDIFGKKNAVNNYLEHTAFGELEMVI